MYTCKLWGDLPVHTLEQAQCHVSVYLGGEEAMERLLDTPPALFVVSLAGEPPLEEICELTQWLRYSRVIAYGEADAQTAKLLLNAGVFAIASDENELYALTLRAQADLDFQVGMMRENRLLHAKVQRSSSLLREKFVEDMLFGSNLSSIDIQRQLEFFNIELETFALLAIELDPLANLGHTLNEDDVNTLIFIVIDQIETLLEDRGIEGIVCVRSRRIYTIIPSKASDTQNRYDMLTLADDLGAAMEDFGRFTVSVGISRVHVGVGQLRTAREEGDRCLAARFHLGDNCVLHIDDLPPSPEDLTAEIDIEPFQRAVSSGSSVIEEAQSLARRFSIAGDPLRIKNVAVEAITAGVLAYCEAFGTMQELFDDGSLPLDRVLRSATVESVASELIDVAARIQAAITRKLSSNAGRAIESAKAYIDKHYADEITLAEVAGSVHMSQWYFSKLFRKETGTTFSDYLIELRIRRAKELIRSDAAMKNYEIAERVGFSDSRYFGQLFKKTTGMTPGEYRRIPTEPKMGAAEEPTTQRGATSNWDMQRINRHRMAGYRASELAREGKNRALPLNIPPTSTEQAEAGIEDIAAAVEAGRSREARQFALRALKVHTPPPEIIRAMIASMDRVGDRYRNGEVFVPEMLLSARAMSVVLEVLQPHLEKSGRVFEGKVLIGTVVGDLHDVGKNLVAMMLRGSGFDVVDLGVNVPDSEFVEAVRKLNPDIVGLSALLTSTMGAIGSTIKALDLAGLRNEVAIMIGGAPVRIEDVARFGADGYSEDAAEAVDLARRLMRERNA